MNITVLKTFQIIVAFLLVVLILVQSKGQGLSAGVASAFSMYRSRRGAEKIIFISTIVFAILLILNSMAILFIG